MLLVIIINVIVIMIILILLYSMNNMRGVFHINIILIIKQYYNSVEY